MADYWNWWEKLRQAGATPPASMMTEEPTSDAQLYVTTGRVLVEEVPANHLNAIQTLMAPNNLGTVKLAMFPKAGAGNGAKLVNSGMSIATNSSNVPAAAAFINFWTNDAQGAKVYASDNGAVSVTKLLNAQIADETTPKLVRDALSFTEQVIRTNPPIVRYPSGYAAVVTSLNQAYQNVAFGKTTVTQAVDTFFSEANATLAQQAG
jgi:multiple sugar transport system substrate-binding protein